MPKSSTGLLDENSGNVVSYSYTDSQWKDLLTTYNGSTITYDQIGNPLSYYNGASFTWKNGRQLESATLTNGKAITYKYNSDGIRTAKIINGVTIGYLLDGSSIIRQQTGNKVMWFSYDGAGTLTSINYNGVDYYYYHNLQGDVIGLYDQNLNNVVSYSYDAWGKLVSITGSMADTLGIANPFRYRGYYYDTELGLYYLNSRYYDPEVGRFINADGYASTGQGVIGCNMFAYCLNNPINMIDPDGNCPIIVIPILIRAIVKMIRKSIAAKQNQAFKNPSSNSKLTEEQKHFVSTIAGEAIGANVKTQKAVAHTIMNRVKEPRDVWNKAKTVNDVLVYSQYNAIGSKQYKKCMNYLNNRDGNNAEYESLISAVIPIYEGVEADFTNGAHYIFNVTYSKELLKNLQSDPSRYVKCGPFQDISDTEYRMYRCLW